MNNKKLTPKDLDNYVYILETGIHTYEISKKSSTKEVAKEPPKVELPSRRSDN